MRGLMMDTPLLITSIMRYADVNHSARELVSVTADNPRHRYCYADAFRRARQLAHALRNAGIGPGDRVATLAWNDHRHFEAYFGVSCSGAVLHTVNPRLFPEQIRYIVNHGGARLVLADPRFVPLLEEIQAELEAVERFVVLTDSTRMPDTALRRAQCYESWIATQPESFAWPDLDENSASAICYTSGTTGHPKGVVYSHRSTVLHALASALPDVMNLSAMDSVLPIVPMFHVNAWGSPYTAPMMGAKLVLPGSRAGDRRALHDLFESERVTQSLAVPTVWIAYLDYLEKNGLTVSTLKRVVVGGAACPPAVIDAFRERHNVDVHHSWGMTEMSPVGAYNSPKPATSGLPAAERRAQSLKQGRAVFGVEMQIVDDEGRVLPRDGQARGRLQVRGPWVCSGYFRPETMDRAEPGPHVEDGWFDTGDVATIDAEGFMEIADRTKDLIKSGGEWISSIELENIAADHPQVAEAAVIAVGHAKWTERPLLIVVPKPGRQPDRQSLRAWYRGKVARWWIPDDVVFVDELPHTATGKVHKSRLREQFGKRALHGSSAAPDG